MINHYAALSEKLTANPVCQFSVAQHPCIPARRWLSKGLIVDKGGDAL